MLYALLVASVVLVIGLTLSNIILKQLIISSTSREMNSAYYAANAGRECASLIRAARSAVAANENFSLASNHSVKISCTDNSNTVDSGPSDIELVSDYEWSLGGDITSIAEVLNSSLVFSYDDGLVTGRSKTACAQFDLPIVDGVDANDPTTDGNINFVFSRGYNTDCSGPDADSPRRVERVLCQDFDLTTNSCKVER